MAAVLEIENLSAFYGKAQALRDVSLSVEEGETIAIVGSPEQVVDTMRERYGGMISRTGFGGAQFEPDELSSLLERLRQD